MDIFNKILKLASEFYAEAQVMAPGSSSLSTMKKQEHLKMFKQRIVQALETGKLCHTKTYKPGKRIIPVIDSMLSGNEVSSEAKNWAKLEMRGLYELFSEAEVELFNSVIDTYNSYE